MNIINKFLPSQDILNKLSFKDQKKVRVLLSGNFICVSMFFLFAVALLVTGKLLTGSLMFVLSAIFASSAVIVKKGKLSFGSTTTTLGLIFACVIISFLTSHVSHPVVCYRTVCFCIAVGNLNYMISLKRKQLWIYMCSSIFLLFASTFILHYPDEFMSNPAEWISSIIINIIAILCANLILLSSDKSNEEIISHSEKEHSQVASSLSTITNVLQQVKESINVGQKLNHATDSASSSVDAINNVYRQLSAEAEKLNIQTNNIKNSSSIVNQKSETMTVSISEQNKSLTEVSNAITEIASNISNINHIAENRRNGMTEVTEMLNKQTDLISILLKDMEKLKESSDGIAVFVKTVDSIAQQTGVLAMNASIEASHAGEKGKGFSVIAQEIRKLSEQTTLNAKKINETLSQNADVVKGTMSSVNMFADVTNKSSTEIQETFSSMEEIIHGISEIDNNTREITGSVKKVVTVADNNTKVIEEVVNQISGQNGDISEITKATILLKERVETINSLLENISAAIEEIHLSAVENEDVSSRIAQILN